MKSEEGGKSLKNSFHRRSQTYLINYLVNDMQLSSKAATILVNVHNCTSRNEVAHNISRLLIYLLSTTTDWPTIFSFLIVHISTNARSVKSSKLNTKSLINSKSSRYFKTSSKINNSLILLRG
jgi:hypothetical protein